MGNEGGQQTSKPANESSSTEPSLVQARLMKIRVESSS
jgi:hypothetical protein